MHLPLSPRLRISPRLGAEQDHPLSEEHVDAVYMPRQHFRKGAVCRRDCDAVPADGTVHVRLSTRFAREAARGAWVLRVTVNGVPVQRWRGALQTGRFRTRIDGIRRGDIVGFEIVSLQDRAGAASWEKASLYLIEEVRFSPREVPSGDLRRAHTDVPDPQLDPQSVAPEGVVVPIEALLDTSKTLPELTWDSPQQWAVSTDQFVLPLLVVPRSSATGSVVLSNGAVDLERSDGRPVFQRSSWHTMLEQHQVYVCDPGTVGAEALPLSWGHLSGGVWCVPEASRAIRAVLSLLEGTQAQPRLYFGSSAGGFWALGLMHHDPGSGAVVNNTQFDCTRWMAGGVNALRHARFQGSLPATIRRAYPERTSMLRLLATVDAARIVDYHVNASSPHDRTVDLEQARRFIAEHPRLAAGLRIHEYEDPVAGHNPLPQDRTLEAIRSGFERLRTAG